MPRLLPSALTLLVVAATTACQVRTAVTVNVEEDGSGEVAVVVTLDPEAVERLPDLDGDGAAGPVDLAALVRDDDLVAAGWTVAEPEARDDGTVHLEATRSFGTPAEADRVLAGLTGPSGALSGLHLTRTESFGRTRYTFHGTADLSGGLEAFGDEGLAAALEGEPLGEDAAALEERLGTPLAEAFTLEVTAALPGEETTWSPRLGGDPVDMQAGSTVVDWPVVVLALLAALSLGALVVVLVVRAVPAVRARHR